MGKDPTIPFYAQDFYMDTLQWSENEVGAYIRLLCSMWINGFCYNSAIELANISPLAKQVVDKYPDKFIFFDDNKFSSKRLEIERDKRIKHRELRSIAGKKGAESRWQTDSKDYGKKITKVNEKENEDVKKDKKKKHKYGEYKNVLLTDIELQKIKDKFPNWEELIKKIDEGIEMKGYKYKSHYLAIVNVWSKNDKGDTVPKPKKEVNYYLYRCPVCQKEFKKREKKAEGVGGYECDEKKCQELLTNNQYRGHYLKLKDIILKKEQ